ncbi:uncharacterized protein LOC125940730 [Dermacentor silvarum]|uniref:uncharacterized protein LOC125940730 n=1 Tax=Dermacentor silvarum TaxID=543639 RepID=UPI002100ED5E|nr:uncharacterized protein LOC125940730 [Dermacentor silvarum]
MASYDGNFFPCYVIATTRTASSSVSPISSLPTSNKYSSPDRGKDPKCCGLHCVVFHCDVRDRNAQRLPDAYESLPAGSDCAIFLFTSQVFRKRQQPQEVAILSSTLWVELGGSCLPPPSCLDCVH